MAVDQKFLDQRRKSLYRNWFKQPDNMIKQGGGAGIETPQTPRGTVARPTNPTVTTHLEVQGSAPTVKAVSPNQRAEQQSRGADYYRTDPTTGLSQYRIDEIRRKAEAGIPLQTQGNPYFDALYEKFSPKKPAVDEEAIRKQIENQIAQQTQTITQQLERMLEQSNRSVTQNESFLKEQLENFRRQQALSNEKAIQLQNRRGGFYSGGLDYQMGQNAKAFGEASQSLTRDIAQRNADIYNRNALLAEQAQDQIKQLQMQAPDLIRQRIQEALDRDRQFSLQEAGLTGVFNGSPTLQARNQHFNQQLAEAGLTGIYNGMPTLDYQNMLFDQNMAVQDQQLREMQIMAALTGFLPDGTPTTEYQQQQLQNLWMVSEQLGVIHPQLAQMYGIPEGTPTYQAKQDAIRNAQESARIALSRQREARIASGGGRSSGGSSGGSSGTPSYKTMSAKDSYNNAISYWSNKVNELKQTGNFPGAYQIEQALLKDQEAINEVLESGYDLDSFIDALYFVSSDGQFKSKEDYEKYVESLKG